MLTIDKFILFDLFIEFLKDETLKKEIIELNIIKRENYENERKYLYAIDQYVSSIEITKSKSQDEGTIEFNAKNIQEKKDWEKILINLESSTNKLVQEYLKIYINKEITNMLILQKIMVEDTILEIERATKEFRKSIDNRIFLLERQASIALKNNIIKPSNYSIKVDLEAYNNVTDTNILDKYYESYYMKGYELIRREIEFYKNEKIELRFSSKLNSLKEKKNKLEGNVDIKRLKAAFKQTPIFKEDNFLAGKIIFVENNKKKKINMPNKIKITIAILIGLIIGCCYVLIEKLLFNRKKQS